MSRWLKEPLLHFLVLGALIFLVYGWLSDERSADEIFISGGQQDNLINTFTRTWQRPPTPAEFKGLLDDYVREEIAYREGTAMGLNDNDVIIRRRLRQKLELLAEDVASLSAPDDAQLQAFLDENSDEYLIEPRFSFQQIYFSPDRREDPAADAELQLAQLLAASESLDYSTLGDSIALPGKVEDLRLSEIARVFGSSFGAQLMEQHSAQLAGPKSKQAGGQVSDQAGDQVGDQASGEPGSQWTGPWASGFGLHLVKVTQYVPGTIPSLEQVRDVVQRDWFSVQRRAAVDGLYQRLAGNYNIEIEPLDAGLPADATHAEGAAAQ